MTRVELKNDQWVELRDPKELKTKDIKRALGHITDANNEVNASFELAEALANILITSWSFERPLPSTGIFSAEDVIDDFGDYKTLTEALTPAISMITGVVSEPGDAGDAESPSKPSNE
jgi:hypothetical protein